MTPTPEERAKLRELHAAATQGEWVSSWDEEDGKPSKPSDGEDNWSICTKKYPGNDGMVVGVMYYDGYWSACTAENSRAIVAAHNTLPRLLDALDVAEKEIARLQAGGCARGDQRTTQHCAEAVGLAGRIRTVAQKLIAEIGASGPENAEDTADRAVVKMVGLAAENKRLREALEKMLPLGGGIAKVAAEALKGTTT